MNVKGNYEFVIEFDTVAWVYNGNQDPCKLNEFGNCTLHSLAFGFIQISVKKEKQMTKKGIAITH